VPVRRSKPRQNKDLRRNVVGRPSSRITVLPGGLGTATAKKAPPTLGSIRTDGSRLPPRLPTGTCGRPYQTSYELVPTCRLQSQSGSIEAAADPMPEIDTHRRALTGSPHDTLRPRNASTLAPIARPLDIRLVLPVAAPRHLLDLSGRTIAINRQTPFGRSATSLREVPAAAQWSSVPFQQRNSRRVMWKGR
jgi:hypothetical protein